MPRRCGLTREGDRNVQGVEKYEQAPRFSRDEPRGSAAPDITPAQSLSAIPRWLSFSRSALRARDKRLRIVPMGTINNAAASS